MLLEITLAAGSILLVVPKSAEKSVWLRNIDRYLRPHYQRALRQHLRSEGTQILGDQERFRNRIWIITAAIASRDD